MSFYFLSCYVIVWTENCITAYLILKDEIDALAASRISADTDSRGHNSQEGVLTSLLNEMDGVQELLGVTVVAATNRPDVIVSDVACILDACTHYDY